MKSKSANAPSPSRAARSQGADDKARDITVPHNLYALVSAQAFFKGLTSHQLQLLADSAMEERFKTGETIGAEGDPANRFYIILEGKVLLETAGDAGEAIAIQTLGPGEDIGWSWLFSPYRMLFTSRALTPVRVIFFYGTRLREQCEADHDLGYELMKRFAGVMVSCLESTRRNLVKANPC